MTSNSSPEVLALLRSPAPPRATYPGSIAVAEPAHPGEMPRPTSPAARKGLAYQRQVTRALDTTARAIGGTFYAEPWFRYKASAADPWRLAVPDGIFTFGTSQLVIEVKLSFVFDAPEKLQKLYVPVVALSNGLHQRPLVITRTLTPQAVGFPLVETLSEALDLPISAPPAVLLWLGSGPIPWTSQLGQPPRP